MRGMKRIVRLKLIGGGHVDLQEGVPKNRGECREGPRPCGYVRCKFHLWRIDADERAGNYQQGGGLEPSTTLRPAWLEWPVPPSCALDCAEKGGMDANGVAEAMGMHRTNLWLITQRANMQTAFDELRALLADGGGEVGITSDDAAEP